MAWEVVVAGTRHRHVAPALDRALPLRTLLDTPILEGASLVAGAAGIDRMVDRLNVMEVPDILPWVKPREFLLTTAYPLREHPEGLADLVADLDDAGLSAIGVKLGRYVDELPARMLEVADERGFPIVLLPTGVAFDEIFNEILTSILNRQAAQLERAERIHRAFLQLVLEGDGLPAIAANLADLTDGPAAIVDRDGRVLAASRCDEVAGWTSTPDRLDLRGDGHVRVGHADVPAVVVPVTAGPRLHGHVVALAGGRTVTGDLAALESAATVAALAMTMRAEVQAIEDKYQSDLVHDLLSGRALDHGDVVDRARSFGWDLERRLIAVVVQFDVPTEPVVPDPVRRRRPLIGQVRQPVQARDPGAAVVRFSDEVVVLTGAFAPDDGGREAATAFVRSLVDAVPDRDGATASAGVSRPVDDLADVPVAYDQAATALRIGRRVHGDGATAHFDDLGVHRVLSLIPDGHELQHFAADTLGALAGDDEDAVELRRTLRVLLESNVNVAEAARRLYVHYNTLRYRIEKLERIVGPFTHDARVRLDVHVALLIRQMHRVETSAGPG